MPKCNFCGISIEKGTGKIFVYSSGKIANFCTNKCEKNLLKLKRKPIRMAWTEAYRTEHKKGEKFTAKAAKDVPTQDASKDTSVKVDSTKEVTAEVSEKTSENKESKVEK